mgnify:CR=1 FL=1
MIYASTVQFTPVAAHGNDRVVKHSFIIKEAMSHGEAEGITYEECNEQTDIDVIAVKRSKIKEILNKRQSDADYIFIADVADRTTDENGDEKELVYKMAFYANNADNAFNFIMAYLRQGYNMTLVGLKKTKFCDVIEQ